MNRKLLALLGAVIVAVGVARPANAGTEPATYTVSTPGHTLRDAVVDTGLGRIFALEVREGPRVERLVAFDLETRTVVGDLPLADGYINDRPRLAIDPATHTIYVLQVIADRTSRVTVIDGETLTVTATAAGPDLRLIRAGFDLPSHTVYASPQAGDMGLHEISLEPETLGQSRHFIPVPARLNEIVVHHGTRRIYAVGMTGGVFAIDGVTRQVVASAPMTGTSIAVDQNTRLVYLTTDTGIMTLDPDTLGTIATIAVPQMGSNAPVPARVAVNSTLGRAYVGLFSEVRMLVVDGANARIEHAIAIAAGIHDGGAMLANETNGHVYLVSGTRIQIVDDVYAPASPVVTTTTGNHQVRLDWHSLIDGGSTIAAYEILVDGQVAAIVGGDTTHYVVNGLRNGTTHDFRVRAVNAAGSGPTAGWSTSAGAPVAVPVGAGPGAIGVDAAANVVYVANSEADTISVVDGVTWTVIDTLPTGRMPNAVAVDAATRRVYVSNRLSHDVTVIDGNARAVVATVPVGEFPWGIAVDPGTRKVYVANSGPSTVSIIDGNTNTVLQDVPVGERPTAIAINTATHTAYVVNTNAQNVSVIGPSFNVVATVPIAGPDLSMSTPITVAIDRTTQMVFVAGLLRNGSGLWPVIKTIDGTTNTAGPDLIALWNFDWAIEAVAVNSVTGWGYFIWNESEGEWEPSDEFRDQRFDGRKPELRPLGAFPAVAAGFTKTLHSVAVDDARNIVYVTGTMPDGQGVLISYTGAKRDQTVGIAGASTGAVGGYVPLVTSGGASGNPVHLSVHPSSEPNVCTVGSGGTVLLAAAGTCVVAATQQGDDNFNDGSATLTIEVGMPAQTISFDDPGPGVVGGSATLSATGGASMNPVVFDVEPASSGVCTVSGNVVTYAAAGTCVVVATQAGNAEYLPAEPVTRSILVVPAGVVVSWPTPASIRYGAALDATQLNATTNVPGTFSYSPAAGTVLEAGSHVLTVTFTPDDTVNYIGGMGSVTIDVAKANVDVVWTPAAGIVYGSPLGAAQLNATADVPGTFVYSPEAGTVLDAGMHTLSVTFTPDDATNYGAATASVMLSVAKAKPAITWPQPGGLVYGASLGSAQLNATAAVPGTFVYSPAEGTVLNAGMHTLSVTFTPLDAVNYTSATSSVTIVVTAPPATVAWQTPDPIAYGTALGSGQLNATATVPGTFAYTPAAGTVLAPGTHALRVVFTPATGMPVSSTVSLRVHSQLEMLEQQIAALRALRGSAGNVMSRLQLEAAILTLSGATSPRLWERDGITLDDRQGSRVFILTRVAAKISGQAAKGRRSGIDERALETIHRALAEIDRQLAATAIDAAGRRATPDAKRELRAGDEDFADGRYLSAMDHYGDAWEDAEQKGGRKHDRHDDHDHDRDCRHQKRRGR